MAAVTIYIGGRSYDIACDSGQEGRVVELAKFIDQKMQIISRSGAALNEAHLMTLTALVLADELFDIRDSAEKQTIIRTEVPVSNKEEQLAMVRLLEQMTKRIDGLAASVGQL